MDTSYRLYAGGELVASGGRPGRSAETTKAAYAPRLARLSPGVSSLDLRLEVANFVHLRGGPFKPILIGEAGTLAGRDALELIFAALVAGFLFAMGGVFLVYAALRRSSSAACFGLAFFLGSVEGFLLSGQLLAYRFFPGIDWETFVRASAFVSYLLPAFVFLAAHELYGGLSDRAALAACAPAAILALAYLAAPLSAFGPLNIPSMAIAFALLAAAFALAARASAKGYPYARVISLGFLLVIGNALNSAFFASGRSVENSFFPLYFLSVFLGPSYGARLAVDFLSLASAFVAIGASSLILFSDSSKRARIAEAVAGEDGPERVSDAFEALGLTAREEEVARLALVGKRGKDIAEALFISLPTVKSHLARVYAKVGVKSRSELFAYFERRRSRFSP
jgi:DNA-binding CsgD family transcriptional regulator